jgi:hypothetical protein
MERNLIIWRQDEAGLAHSAQTAHAPGPAHAHPADSAAPTGLGRGRRALLWGIGSSVLSVLGFIALALFEQYNGLVSELRSDLKHFNETSADFVKRDNFQRFRDQLRERLRGLQEVSADKVRLEQELKLSEHAREEMASELQHMRERLAFLEGRQTQPASVPPPTAPRK